MKEPGKRFFVTRLNWLDGLCFTSIQRDLNNQTSQTETIEQPSAYVPGRSDRGQLYAKRATLINPMRGFLKIDQAAPTDAEVQAMLEERLIEKHLQ